MIDKNELLEVMCFGMKAGRKIPPSVRQFCLSLHFYSPRAYQHVRQTFNNNFPHPTTIRRWYSNSDVSGEAGIQPDNIKRLERIVAAHNKKHKSGLVCGLIFDEMHIRQQISFVQHHGFSGFETNEQNPETDNIAAMIAEEEEADKGPSAKKSKLLQNNQDQELHRAKQAIVFILNGINYAFEFPVAYWLIDTLNKLDRKILLDKVIESVTKAGIKIASVTFDGHPSNVPMCHLLGAELDVFSPEFNSFFLNSVDGSKVNIFIDPCHVEKLI